MPEHFRISPVGIIRKRNETTRIEIAPAFAEAMSGLEGFSHIQVCYWFHENDTPDKRSILRVHPRNDPANPLTGVFATHSPLRPNLLAFSICEILSIYCNMIHIDAIDARPDSPVIDIKCYIPSRRSFEKLRLPDWV